MTEGNNSNSRFNGRGAIIGLSLGGAAGILTAFGMVTGWIVAPVRDKSEANDKRLLLLESRLDIIQGLAAQRGVQIPRLEADQQEAKAELRALRERLDRMERAERAPR